MGQSSAKVQSKVETVTLESNDYGSVDYNEFPMEIQVAHYTPASFPLTPVVTEHTITVCKASWEKVLQPIERDDGTIMAGLTAFYTEFYDTLDVLDTAGKFQAVLSQHTGGVESKVAKGAILLRIINYALNLDAKSEKTRFALFCLGKSHNQKMIRPWQYAVFIQCLLTTLSSRLGNNATHESMSAWVHLFAFLLRNMLPAAISGLVDDAEVNVNVTSEVGDVDTTDQIRDADQFRELRKQEKKLHSRGSSSNSSVATSRQASTRVPVKSERNKRIS